MQEVWESLESPESGGFAEYQELWEFDGSRVSYVNLWNWVSLGD